MSWRRLLSFLAALWLCVAIRPARAVEGDATFPAEPSAERATYGKSRVVLYGPVRVTPQLQNGQGTVAFSFEGVDTGGRILSAQLFLVDASHQTKGPFTVDPVNAFGDLSGMEGSPNIPVDLIEEVHDTAGGEVPHQPLTHLRQWDQVMLAVAINEGNVKIGRIVLTPDLTAFAAQKRSSPKVGLLTCWEGPLTRDALSQCANGDVRVMDARLAEVVARLNTALPPKFRPRLKAAQSAWQKSRDASCSLYADSTSGCDGQGPSCAMRLSMRTGCLIDEGAGRLLFLKEILRFP